MNAYADLFAEDAVLELPFAPHGFPARIEGRENLRALFQAGAEQVRDSGGILGFDNIVVRLTDDPEVVLAEFTVRTGQTEFTNLQLLRAHDGHIVSLRDFWSPLERPELRTFALRPVIGASSVRVWPRTYELCRVDAGVPLDRAFMVANDHDATTAIVEDANGVWRLIEMAVLGPAVGFLALVTGALAEAGVELLVVSTYSKDFVLVKNHTLTTATDVLTSLGFRLH